jgi:hypothetical protein
MVLRTAEIGPENQESNCSTTVKNIINSSKHPRLEDLSCPVQSTERLTRNQINITEGTSAALSDS